VPWDGLEECGLHLHELKPKTVSSLGMTAIVQALFFQVAVSSVIPHSLFCRKSQHPHVVYANTI